MKNQYITLIILSVLGVCLIGGIIGLAMTIHYPFNSDISTYRQSECVLYSCVGVEYPCWVGCGFRKSCLSTCMTLYVNYSLFINETVEYNKIVNLNRYDCLSPNITCYYRNDDIYNSLSLKPLAAPTSVVGIVLLSLFITIMLIVMMLVSYCMIHCHDDD